MSYEDLLKQAYKKVKPIKHNGERFEIPVARSMIEGNKTFITNFSQLTSALRRKPQHLEKYLERELAAPGQIKGDRLILTRKLPNSKINDKIKSYVQEFVICKECKKPDTELIKQDRAMIMHCLACGARHSVRAKI